MKWLIASDIHGSAYYCQKLIDAYARENANRLLLLGDLLYHGPRNELPRDYSTKSVIGMLNGIKDGAFGVRGNCDALADQMALQFPIMADYTILCAGDRMIFATHGHIYNHANLPPLHKGDILLHGHTHVSVCEEHEGYTYCNPGSVSLPLDGTPHGYMTLEDGIFSWKTLDGEVYRTYRL